MAAGSASTCSRSPGWSGRCSATRGWPSGSSPRASAATPRTRARPGRHLAARFAAKEAVVKALGLSGGFGLREIEVVAGEPPTVRLQRPRRRGGRRASEIGVSLTHSRDFAAAVAMIG